MKNLRDELNQMKLDLDLIQKVYCTKEEEQQYKKMTKEKQLLPNDVKHYDTGYFRYIQSDLSKEELNEFIVFRQLSYLRTIKNCMIFFVVLPILALIILLIISSL